MSNTNIYTKKALKKKWQTKSSNLLAMSKNIQRQDKELEVTYKLLRQAIEKTVIKFELDEEQAKAIYDELDKQFMKFKATLYFSTVISDIAADMSSYLNNIINHDSLNGYIKEFHYYSHNETVS